MNKILRRFRRDEDGSALLIEFAIFVPLLFGAFLMSVEMGIYSMRQMYLDRGLDIAVRFIRLNTNTKYTHDDIKQMICDNSGWLENCDETLRLEMTAINPRQFAQFDQDADCVDTSQPVQPVRGFTLGRQNELMMLRACVRFKPVYPTSGLGHAFEKDGTGRARMISTAAFVQEPS
ncbi:pilus assembly protein [Sulfitobacter sp. F26204]|uniref:TadE/TadG family type IV pilus assembly protein n=1 Tax=Sulfitobacter sp. F26204 TaxID=2996014 RepID=UPI00225DF0FE|nr:TadE/TadG family type IV pilus assembly protein [Sulfitobacter sp. F26204]MCX7560847.1 pilus assembly protein [Sulfitobacter sp. F26204]